MLEDRILFVDDDENVLDTYRRLLNDKLHIETALGGQCALTMMDNEEPFAVVVSDLRMPSMDGNQFLSHVRERFPDTVRMMLTGNADLEAAITAVNEGNIFRLLSKPCPPGVVMEALIAGIDQYRLVTAEKELLEKTLLGSIKLLTDILALADPTAFGRAATYQEGLQKIADKLHVEHLWDLKMAWMLSNLGHVVIPAETLSKLRAGSILSGEEKRLIAEAPQSVCRLLKNIPRLERVGQIISYRNKHFDGSGYPENTVKGEDIPIESRILKLLGDLAQAENPAHSKIRILKMMENRAGWYDTEVLQAAAEVFAPGVDMTASEFIQLNVKASELKDGDTLVTDLITKEGQLLVAGGQTISEMYLERVRNFAHFVGIEEPVIVKRARASRENKPHGLTLPTDGSATTVRV